MELLITNTKELKEKRKKLCSIMVRRILKQWRNKRFLRRHQVKILWMTLIKTTISTRKLKLKWTSKIQVISKSSINISSFVEFIVLSSILSYHWELSTWRASNRTLSSLLLCRLSLTIFGTRSVDSQESLSSMGLHCWSKFWKKLESKKQIKLLS
jgi:hypothetical protein